jgi:hypothetical protein
MRSVAVRFALFCMITVASTAVLIIPYLTIQ